MKMNYCMECGTLLHSMPHGEEGLVPYCDTCAAFRYPVFNTAVSLLVVDETEENILLIRQYGKPDYILVAGYVNQGEDAEDAARRELMEELSLPLTGTSSPVRYSCSTGSKLSSKLGSTNSSTRK